MAMKSCPYIMFGTITYTYSAGTTNSNVIGSAIVWRREKLSEILGMTESQLVEWVLLIGNDYTKHFYLSPKISPFSYDDLIASTHSNKDMSELEISQIWELADRNRLDALRAFILSRDPTFLLTSDIEDVEAALRYSRRLYDLEDVSDYDKDERMPLGVARVCEVTSLFNDESCSYVDKVEFVSDSSICERYYGSVQGNFHENNRDKEHGVVKDESVEEGSGLEDDPYQLTNAQREAFRKYITLNSRTVIHSCDVGDCILEFLQKYLFDRELIKNSNSELEVKQRLETEDMNTGDHPIKKRLFLSRNIFPEITMIQLKALRSMLVNISARMKDLRDTEMKYLAAKLLSNLSIITNISANLHEKKDIYQVKNIGELENPPGMKVNTPSNFHHSSTPKYIKTRFENVRAAHTYQLLCNYLVGLDQRLKSSFDVSTRQRD